jgi:hypothetical protein
VIGSGAGDGDEPPLVPVDVVTRATPLTVVLAELNTGSVPLGASAASVATGAVLAEASASARPDEPPLDGVLGDALRRSRGGRSVFAACCFTGRFPATRFAATFWRAAAPVAPPQPTPPPPMPRLLNPASLALPRRRLWFDDEPPPPLLETLSRWSAGAVSAEPLSAVAYASSSMAALSAAVRGIVTAASGLAAPAMNSDRDVGNA